VLLSLIIEGPHTKPLKMMCPCDRVRPAQGYRGCQNTSARRSVGRCSLNPRKPQAKPIGFRFPKCRRCTKAVGSRFFLKLRERTKSVGRFFKKMRPVRVSVLHGWGDFEILKGTCFPREQLVLLSAVKCTSPILRGVE